MSIAGVQVPVSYPQTDLDQLKNNKAESAEEEKARLLKATKEFESFFTYQLLKTMRKTIPESPFSDEGMLSGGMGKDIFTDMFDMQIAKKMVGTGNQSIAQMLYKSLEKLIDQKYAGEEETSEVPLKSLNEVIDPFIEVPEEPLPELPSDENELKPLEKEEQFRVLPQLQARITQDPILAEYGDIIQEAAKETGLDPKVIYSVIKTESSGNAKAVSSAGAKGLMQLIDSTATDYGVKDQFDPKENIMGGSRFLKDLVDRFGSLKLALAAYNAGPGNVKKYKGIPPFKETEQYVEKVLDSLKTAR